MTPTGRHALTYDEQSWKPSPDETANKDDFVRANESRQSKTQRVKNYIKKCKNALGSKSNSLEQSHNGESSSTSWYVDKKLEDLLNESEINELDDVFEDAEIREHFGTSYQKANVIQIKGEERNEGNRIDEGLEEGAASPPLTEAQEQDDGSGKLEECETGGMKDTLQVVSTHRKALSSIHNLISFN